MNKYLILYNPLSQKGRGLRRAKKAKAFFEGAEVTFEDITKIRDVAAFIRDVPADTGVILTGGDGTLSRTMDALYGQELGRDLLYFGAGSGNDFLRDIGKSAKDAPFSINQYMENLPLVKVNGLSMRFINGVGLGLDGFVCEEVNRAHTEGKEISYGAVALKGVVWKYKPLRATVTVDGDVQSYDKVWLAPVMFGSYFGGGFRMAPRQSRNDPGHLVTSIVVHDVGRFAAIFRLMQVKSGKGELLKSFASYRTGRHVIAEFDSPCAFQIDGETIPNVTRYEVFAGEA